MKNALPTSTPSRAVKDRILTPIMLGEALLVVVPLAWLITALSTRQTASVKRSVRAEGERVRSRLPKAPGEAPAPAEAISTGAALHWQRLIDELPADLRSMGFTERQVQVAMGVVRQQTYQQIAREAHLDERTVRQHASSAFRKVGCTKKADFLGALMARIGGGTLEL